MVDTSLLVPGAVVRIVDSWDQLTSEHAWQAPGGQMDHWLGRTMTIRYTPDDKSDLTAWYGMKEDVRAGERGGSGWVWQQDGFAEIVSSPLLPPKWDTVPEESDMSFSDFFSMEVAV